MFRMSWIGIAEFQIAIEAGEVADDRPDRQKREQQRQIMAEGIDVGKTLAEKLEVHQQAAQQIGDHEGDTRHREVVQQGDRTEKFGTSIEHSNCRWLK